MSDEELIIDYRDTGNSESFTELVERYQDELVNYLRRQVGDYAEDVAQITFMQVHLRCSTFQDGKRFRPWLFTIAMNRAKCLIRWNKRKRRSDERTECLTDVADKHRSHLEFDEVNKLHDEVQRLPRDVREPLRLVYFHGEGYRQVALKLGILRGTVKSRVHRGLKRLRKRYNTLVQA